MTLFASLPNRCAVQVEDDDFPAWFTALLWVCIAVAILL